ncbi:hypothetical protein TC41_2819 [Alicyclobacillus acidocaldarius subsp. acidocaldarius Tc-4-1]|uniref:Uncharacterized protein n=1 Tax=Alicyclobacillus acidocaldarius (strain Tc-4-1) TaxID=1048834 RepID=F8IJJ9_ALIAT|nr:hypothetical protein TC41_2819 [Alicyclobacillus acidocaldarius subsp. acidocaldarius Tc-4-1]
MVYRARQARGRCNPVVTWWAATGGEGSRRPLKCSDVTIDLCLPEFVKTSYRHPCEHSSPYVRVSCILSCQEDAYESSAHACRLAAPGAQALSTQDRCGGW